MHLAIDLDNGHARDNKRYPHDHHIHLRTARRAFLLEHVVLELVEHVACGIVFTNNIPSGVKSESGQVDNKQQL
jgi:hypothetical protein